MEIQQSNAERFLESFNAIENFLRRNLEARNFVSYFSLLDDASDENVVVRQYREQLRLFGNLRNAIIHSEKKQGKPVADPREDIVVEIEKIAKILMHPPLVCDHFLSEVYCVSPEENVVPVLQKMVAMDYSQAPIIKEGYILGLINYEAMARWIAKLTATPEPLKLFRESSIQDVLNGIIRLKNYRIIKKDTDFVTAREYFVESLGNPHPAEALLITETGRRDEPVLGIVTISEDLEKIIEVLRK
jgi:CBS domain-containing protein